MVNTNQGANFSVFDLTQPLGASDLPTRPLRRRHGGK